MFKKFLAALAMFSAAFAFAATDVNKATAAELDAINGIGPGISTKILDERKKGNFKDWNDLITRVGGVGETNAAKFSEGGLTVGGATYKGVAAAPAAPKKEEKPAAKAAEAKADAKPTAAAAPAADMKKDAKPAAAAPAADMKKDAKPAAAAPAADMKKDAKPAAAAPAADMKKDAKPAAEDKKAKADADKAAKADAKAKAAEEKKAKADAAKPAASGKK
jgi:competence protein ComEA